MSLLKRAEVWVLLAIAIAGLIFAFTSRHHDDETNGAASSGAASVSDDGPLKLHRCVLKRDYGNARLDIELRVRNISPEKLVLQSPQVKLLTAKGREIPSFFLPFEPQPEVAANSTQDVQLRYWLEAADLQSALKLEVTGRSVEIKSAKAFDLNSMKNAGEKTFKTGEW